MRGLFPDKITEIFEFDGQIDVVGHDVFGDGEDDGGEIQDAGHAAVHQMVGHFLGGGGGDGEDGHFHAMLGDEFGHDIHAENGLGDLFVAGAAGVGVEGGDDLKAFLFKAAIGEQGQTEVADADENDGLQSGGAEFFGDAAGEFGDVIAEAAGAEGAKAGQIFAELGGFYAGRLGQRLAGDGIEAVLFETGQAAQINR